MNDKDFRDQVAARVIAPLAARGERADRAAQLAYQFADSALAERSGEAQRRREQARTDASQATQTAVARIGPTAGVTAPPTTETSPATTPQPADGLVTQPGVLTGVPEVGRNPEATEASPVSPEEASAAEQEASGGEEEEEESAAANEAPPPVAEIEGSEPSPLTEGSDEGKR